MLPPACTRASPSSRPRRSAGSGTSARRAMIGMHTFGASAPLKDLQKKFGFTPDAIVATQAARPAPPGRQAVTPGGHHEPAPRAARSRPERLVRLHPPRSLITERGARAPDRRGRPARRHLEPVDLREGDRRLDRLRRRDRRAAREGETDPKALTSGSRSRTSGRRRRLPAGLRRDERGATATSRSRSRPTSPTTPTARSPRRERLWRAIDATNVMIKVPATPAGIPAIRS